MTEVKRRKNESFESLLRRFHKRLQQSGRLLQAKKIRFYVGSENKTKVRARALNRIRLRQEREYLIKTGQITEEELAHLKTR